MQILRCTPEPLNHTFRDWSLVTCVVMSPPGDSYAHSSLMLTKAVLCSGTQQQSQALGATLTLVQIPVLPLSGSVSLGKALSLPKHLLPHLSSE